MKQPRVMIVEDEVIVAKDIQYRLEKLGYGAAVGQFCALDSRPALGVEAANVSEHPQERWTNDIQSLSEQTVQRTPLVFHPRLGTTDTEAHVARPRRDIKQFQ